MTSRVVFIHFDCIPTGRGHNRAVDYWAFGILLYEMEAGYSPFSDSQGMDQVVICKNIVNGKLAFPKSVNTDCKVLDAVSDLLTLFDSTPM